MSAICSSRRLGLVSALLASAALALPCGSRAASPTPSPRVPSVHTGGLPTVSTVSATLKGTINPHGLETVYAFQFGTTAGYGAQTAPVSAGSGTAEIKVSQTISGLQPGTTYHFRLVGTNPAGTANGQDVAFTTKKIPLTFQIAGTPNPVVFGSSFSVGGILSGTGAAGRQIVLQANPYPYLGGFKTIGSPRVTDPGGRFSFSVESPSVNSLFRVAAVGPPTVNSLVVAERVAVRVNLHLHSTGRHGYVRMDGTVAPAEVGVPVGFQLMRTGHRPLTVAGTITKRASASGARFSRVVRIRRGGLYRAYVQVAGGKQVSGYSRSLLIR
jgi:hypothetical protein